MSTPGLSQEDLDLLRKYDTPTICNVIELFQVRPPNVGYIDSRIKACFPEMPPVVGYAATATLRTAAPPRERATFGGGMDKQVAAFAEIPSPPIVVFQNLDDPAAAASIGDVMCTIYKTFGAVGLITSGAARDLDQVRELGFPVFSNGAICSHGFWHIESIHNPVHVGGLAVYPGELLHGDLNGITIIPNDIASDVAHICPEYLAAEQVILEHVTSGSATIESMAAAKAECQRMIEALCERVAKR